MHISDWIQLVLTTITLIGIYVVWRQPKNERRQSRKDTCNRIKKRVSLYLDLFEVKLEKELVLIHQKKKSIVLQGKFEDYNRQNYQALEEVIQIADVFDQTEFDILMEFVHYFKTSENMNSEEDIMELLARIRKKELRQVFPEGNSLQKRIDEVRGLYLGLR